MAQKKVLLYVHDGSGLGHLRRVSRIAAALQGPCATLIVTGQREALWLIPENCEFVHIPNWDKLIVEKAAYWDRMPWLKLNREKAAQFKSDFFLNIVRAFSPDAIFVDYLPLGKRKELEEGLKFSSARKYLINRGIVDAADRKFFYEEALQTYAYLYDRILITADRLVTDVVNTITYDELTSKKVIHVGYIVPEAPDIVTIRKKRGLKSNQKWVVCSAGGGKNGEIFLEQCINVASKMPDVIFDIVFGPKSKMILPLRDDIATNISIWRHCEQLSLMTASSDIAVINGGYNSTMEAVMGGAQIIVYPNQSKEDDEQINNAKALSNYYPITLVTELIDFETILANSLLMSASYQRYHFPLNIKGLANIQEILFNDLNII